MQRIRHLTLLGLAAGVMTACELQHEVPTEAIPTAAVRFVHAVPDTGTMDFRFVDFVENSAHYNFAFRSTTDLYYKGARAGQRHLRIFMASPTDQTIASTVVKDTVVNLVAGMNYTFLLWGFARPGSSPAMRLSVIEDMPADPANQVALRVINAAAGLGPLDVKQYPTGGALPGTPTWANLAALSVSSYVNAGPGSIKFNVTPAGGGANLFTDATAITGSPATIDFGAIPGTTVPGSGVTAIIFPRSVAGSQAASRTTPSIITIWDRRPPG